MREGRGTVFEVFFSLPGDIAADNCNRCTFINRVTAGARPWQRQSIQSLLQVLKALTPHSSHHVDETD